MSEIKEVSLPSPFESSLKKQLNNQDYLSLKIKNPDNITTLLNLIKDDDLRNLTSQMLIQNGECNFDITWNNDRYFRLKVGKDEDNNPIVIGNEITDLQKNTLIDPLTGLGNQKYYLTELVRIQLQYKRALKDETPLTVGITQIDVNKLKDANDIYGHTAGDALLIAVAELLKSCVRGDTDRIFHQSGDEFSILTPGITDAELIIIYDRLNQSKLTVRELLMKNCTEPDFVEKYGNIDAKFLDSIPSLAIGSAVITTDQPPSVAIKKADEKMREDKLEKTGSYGRNVPIIDSQTQTFQSNLQEQNPVVPEPPLSGQNG